MSFAERFLKIDNCFRLCVSLGGLALVPLLSGCGASRSGSTSSQITIQIPQAQNRSASSSTSTYDFSKACFAINVTASDIPATSKPTCDVPRGLFTGFVAPGGSLSVSVPKGTGRTLEIFSYLRTSSTAACQSLTDFGKFTPNQLVRVGYVPSFDTQTDVVTLNVTLTSPAPTDTLLSQYKMAATCNAATVVPPASAGIASAHSRMTTADGSGKFVIEGTVSGQTNQLHLQSTSGTIQIQLSRRPD